MKNIFVILLILFLMTPSVSEAQSPCYTYACNMEKAGKALTDRNYKAALAYCKAAKVYPQADVTEADSLIEVIFVAIDKEKNKAVEAKKEAERQTILVIKERERANDKTREAELAAETARLAKLKAESAMRAAENAAVGMSYMSTNPTLALRMFETNYRQHPDNPSAESNFKKMLNDSTEGYYVRNFEAHTEAITATAVSLDGTKVLTGSSDNTARLWDTQTGKIIRHFVGHTEGVMAVALSADGKWVLTGSGDNTAKLWDARTGKVIRQFVGHTSSISSVAFLPDGKRIVTGSWDRTARLWNAETGQVIREFIGQKDGITCLTLSANGRRLVTGSWDNTATLWIVETGRMVRTFLGHTNTVSAVMLLANGKRLLTGSRDRTAKLWDVETGQVMREFFGHTAPITSVVLLPYVQQAITGSEDGSAKLWDAQTGKVLMEFWGHHGAVNAVAVPADRLWLLTGGNDKTAMMWRLKPEKDTTAQFAYPFSAYTFKKLKFQYEDSMWHQPATLRDTLADTRGKERYSSYHKRLAKTWVRSPTYKGYQQKLDAWLESPLVRVRNEFIGDSILRVGKSIEEIWHYRIDTTKNEALKQQLHQMIIDTLYNRYAQSPKDEVLKYKAIDAYIDASRTALKAKDYKLAKTLAEKGLDIDKTDAEAHYGLADALLFGGNTKKAEALYLNDYLTRPLRDTTVQIDEMTEEKTVIVKVITEPTNVVDYLINLEKLGFKHPEIDNIIQKAEAKGIFTSAFLRHKSYGASLEERDSASAPTIVEQYVKDIEKSRDTLDIYRLYGELISAIEQDKSLVDKNLRIFNTQINTIENKADVDKNYQKVLAYNLSQRAWYGLFVQNYKAAQQDARRAVQIDPNQSFIKSNLGHALLYQDQFDAAMKVYLDFVDDATNFGGITNKSVLLQDFDDLEAAGKGHKDFVKVKAQLNPLNH